MRENLTYGLMRGCRKRDDGESNGARSWKRRIQPREARASPRLCSTLQGAVFLARRIEYTFPETGKGFRRKTFAEHLTGLGDLAFDSSPCSEKPWHRAQNDTLENRWLCAFPGNLG